MPTPTEVLKPNAAVVAFSTAIDKISYNGIADLEALNTPTESLYVSKDIVSKYPGKLYPILGVPAPDKDL